MRARKKTKLVYGVGVNDADYQVSFCATIFGRRKNLWRCPFYQVWNSILGRCYSANFLARQPTYAGCSVAPEWHKFSVFREWMIGQPWEAAHIDKDLLAQGSKIYSPERCVFVPRRLNNFIIESGAARGEWPLGVSWNKRDGKFIARCRNPFTGKDDHLGMFDDQEEAHEAWRLRKHEHAIRYADQQTDPRIAAALRTRYGRQEEV